MLGIPIIIAIFYIFRCNRFLITNSNGILKLKLNTQDYFQQVIPISTTMFIQLSLKRNDRRVDGPCIHWRR